MNTRWRRWFGWSKSRASLFRECRKRYSFQYLFKYEKQEAATFAKLLSKLGDLPIQKGLLIHQEIETFLQIHQRSGGEDLEASRERLRRRFESVDLLSLREFRFRKLTAEEIQLRLQQDLTDALRQLEAFHQIHWPRLKGMQVLSLEKLEKVKFGDDPVWVSADLVLQASDQTLLLVDWKTGVHEHDAETSEQLTGYILWAQQRFQIPPEKIRAELVWLASGRVDQTSRTPQALELMREKIHGDCLEMLSIEDYQQIQATPVEANCRRCPFLPLCREGAEWMDPELRKDILSELRQEASGERKGTRN